MDNHEYIYVLRLNNNKYYIGKTNHILSRLNDHFTCSEKSSEWVKKHGVIKLVEICEVINQFQEDTKTLEYMNKYSIDNVRGGSFCNIYLNETEIFNIKKQLRSANDLCFKCGKAGHFAKNCKNIKPVKKSLNSEILLENKIQVEIQSTTFWDNMINTISNYFDENTTKVICQDTEIENKLENKLFCDRCGRNTHNINNCYANSHLKGHFIK